MSTILGTLFEAIQYNPDACASKSAMPNPSYNEGNKNKSITHNNSFTLSVAP